MLFRPSYCSNCGEKIARADWHIWTSRRFCDVCVTEQPFAEYAPKVLLLFAFVATLAGATSYVTTGSSDSEQLVADKRMQRAPITASLVATPAPLVLASPTVEQNRPSGQTAAVSMPKQIVEPALEAVQYCGALTKKGTACSRRVKGNVRCYQHAGMPAAVEIGK